MIENDESELRTATYLWKIFRNIEKYVVSKVKGLPILANYTSHLARIGGVMLAVTQNQPFRPPAKTLAERVNVSLWPK